MERRAEVDAQPHGEAAAAAREGFAPDASGGDGTRRTSLAAERTWLAWWRTGLAASGVALAVGRLLPAVTHAARWPSRLLGIGYGLLAVGVFVIAARRQRATAAALRRGSFAELSGGVVTALTAVSIVIAVGTLAIIVITF